MSADQKVLWEPNDSILFAAIACLCLGMAMALWGFAPALVARIVTGEAPPLTDTLLNNVGILLGFAMIGMHALIRQCVRWAIWTAFAISVLLLGSGLALVTLIGFRLESSCLLILAAATAISCWFSLESLAKARIKQITAEFDRDRKKPSELFRL